MSLKSLIQRLLDSRTTPEEAGHSAMPSASETVLLTQNDAFQSWGNIYQGVAADDGYVNIFSRSVNNTTSEMRVLTSGMTFSSAQTEAEKDMACSAPVAKGQTYTIKGIQVKMIKIIFVKALGAIGGGYNGFVRRALSCLKPSFNFSPKVFSKAKRRGYLSGRSNWLIPRQSLKYQRQTLGRSSQCRLTVGQLLKAQTILQRRLTATSLKGNTKCSVFASVVSPIALQQFLFRAKKAKPSALPFTQTVRTSPLEHLKHFRLANLETGGALC